MQSASMKTKTQTRGQGEEEAGREEHRGEGKSGPAEQRFWMRPLEQRASAFSAVDATERATVRLLRATILDHGWSSRTWCASLGVQ